MKAKTSWSGGSSGTVARRSPYRSASSSARVTIVSATPRAASSRGGVRVLDLDAWPEADAGPLGALGELSAGRVLVPPAGFGQHERSAGDPFDRHGALGRPERYGLPAPATRNLHRNRPVVNGQLLHFIHHGRVDVTPGIQRFDGHDVHFADGTVRTIDTILYATGFKPSLPFLDRDLLQTADGVPLRVAGMTLPVGLERLYFVGLAAPRGPQLPVYSAQARLIAKFLTAQGRTGIALSATHARAARPEARIDVPRHEWQRDMDRAHRRIDRILRRMPTRADTPQPTRDYLAIHG